jgi:hypothetical protein
MTGQPDDPIDRLIDHAARGMTMGEPSARLEELLQARLKRPRPVSLLSGVRPGSFSRGFQVAVTATAVVTLVLFLWLARWWAQPPGTAAGVPAGTQRPLPPIEPLALESLALESIDQATPLDLAAIEVAPLRLDPMGTVTTQENQ